MRSPIALTVLLSGIVSACSGTTPEGSGTTASGGTSASSTRSEEGEGGATATSERKATGGSSTRTSSRGSAAPTGGSSSSRANSDSGGASTETEVSEGGRTSKGSSAVGGQSKGSKSSAPDGTGGKSTSSSKSAAGGSSTTGGQTSAGGSTTSTGTGAQPAGGSTGESSGKSAGCGKAPTITEYNKGQPISITAGGKQRRYILNVPTNYDNSKPYRLIVSYHQLDGNDKQNYNWQYYGLLPLSNNSTIFVAPNGQKNGSPCSGTGDGDSGCGWPNSGDSDLALADAVVAQMEENFCIDKTRIFAVGWSYGGSMSYRTACSRPQGGTAAWGVRGIAVYSAAQLSGNCTPSKPVAYFHAHGTNDTVLNYDSMGMPLAQNFAKANGCTWATPPKVTNGAHVCTNLAGCDEGYPLEFCSFAGGHTPYPDNGQAQGSWGPAEVWKFISQF